MSAKPPKQTPDPSLVLKQTVKQEIFLHHTRIGWYTPMTSTAAARKAIKDYDGIPEVRIVERITRVVEIDHTLPTKKPCKDCPPETT